VCAYGYMCDCYMLYVDVVLSKFVFTYIGTFVIPNSVEKQRLVQHDAAIHRLAENPVVKIGIEQGL